MESTNYNFHIAELLGKFLKGEISPEEKLSLENWINASEENRELFNKLTNHEFLQEQQNSLNSIRTARSWQMLERKLFDKVPRTRVISINLLKYAAIVIPLIIGSWFFYEYQHNKHTSGNDHVQIAKNNQIHPGGKHAVLILSDGNKLVLGSKTNEMINEKDGTELHNSHNILAYNGSNSSKGGDQVLYNTLVIPRGGEYQLTLADGTKVWMNSASELRYPTKFTGTIRNVYLKGEAYFEVAKNAEMPFIVKTNKTEVQVLGTHFNVSAYDDDHDTKTTLLEGSVKVKSENATATIKPGEQAILNNKGQLTINKDVDIDIEIAWKNGLFYFKKASIEEIMTKASRWYDITVKYEGKIPRTKLNGRMSRDVDMAELLGILQYEGVKFRAEGKNIIVTD